MFQQHLRHSCHLLTGWSELCSMSFWSFPRGRLRIFNQQNPRIRFKELNISSSNASDWFSIGMSFSLFLWSWVFQKSRKDHGFWASGQETHGNSKTSTLNCPTKNPVVLLGLPKKLNNWTVGALKLLEPQRPRLRELGRGRGAEPKNANPQGPTRHLRRDIFSGNHGEHGCRLHKMACKLDVQCFFLHLRSFKCAHKKQTGIVVFICFWFLIFHEPALM